MVGDNHGSKRQAALTRLLRPGVNATLSTEASLPAMSFHDIPGSRFAGYRAPKPRKPNGSASANARDCRFRRRLHP